ncbi:hypothetical protein P153DRAFT_312452 [Dothidotthia symphoricarpi CBS 119687]|uniref:Methyltransferase type 11 domain-containing protein n=1 Tax=Dothidotthia symphoricarpi CBS 119687 TaxID=1392245 RepID=A0A6A6ALF6_9PLEO|nr:uncharacterized protein P153DRAFT_312452 [Dothidotthia symphoricarpi CBS 119687]KAF2131764.1 hypothetical protein P153DRAFT_312452 [Dothidotthia symphoricarpi CBS 119687]
MFSTDLTWNGGGVEMVGERRARKAQERASGTSGASSIRTSISFEGSSSTNRGFRWASGLKKAKELKPSNILRPLTSRSSNAQVTGQTTTHKSTTHPHDLKDPSIQPAWTYSGSLSSNLPSGASLDFPEYDTPKLHGRAPSQCTNSSSSRYSRDEHGLELRAPVRVMTNEEIKQTTPRSIVPGGVRLSPQASRREDCLPAAGCDPEKQRTERRQYPIQVEEHLNFQSLDDLVSKDNTSPALTTEATHHVSPQSKFYRPLSQWESLSPQVIREITIPSKPETKKVAVAHSSTLELIRIQQFIHSIEGTHPQDVLDRLREDWLEYSGEEIEDEVALEKQLWLLTGFHTLNAGKVRIIPKPKCNTGRILELYGNLSEVYQLSATNPHQVVHFLTTKIQRQISLPGNVSYLTVRECGAVPLPYPENYFSHIRASTLPPLVPSAKLPELFNECYKLLAPGGLLEIRIMDAAPLRRTAGPKMRMWIEDRLSLNLERLFRCSRPCLLVPSWLAAAGFGLAIPEGDQNVALPCAFDKNSSDINSELSAIIGKALWKDIWGQFVDDIPDESKWWWEDEEIMQECLQRKTVFECRAIYAYKN